MSFFRNISLLLFIILIIAGSNIQSQNKPVLYFCETYGAEGEVGISDRFTVGKITLMVKSYYPIGEEHIVIQFDRYNPALNIFEFYKTFSYTIEPTSKYVFFSTNEESDLSFDDPGFYRVFLLNTNNEVITSSLVEIVY